MKLFYHLSCALIIFNAGLATLKSSDAYTYQGTTTQVEEQSEKSTEVPCLEKFTTTQEASVGEYSAVHNQDTSVGSSLIAVQEKRPMLLLSACRLTHILYSSYATDSRLVFCKSDMSSCRVLLRKVSSKQCDRKVQIPPRVACQSKCNR